MLWWLCVSCILYYYIYKLNTFSIILNYIYMHFWNKYRIIIDTCHTLCYNKILLLITLFMSVLTVSHTDWGMTASLKLIHHSTRHRYFIPCPIGRWLMINEDTEISDREEIHYDSRGLDILTVQGQNTRLNGKQI